MITPKNVFIKTFFIVTSLGYVGFVCAGSQSAAQQTSSYTLPYVLSPIVNQPSTSTIGSAGPKGGEADCSKAWEEQGKPSDGGQGGAGLSFVNTLGLPNSSIGSSTSPASTTPIYLYSLGGTGGVGGKGDSCYSGYGGGQGGVGGNIAFTTSGSSMVLQTAAIVALSQGGQGGDGGTTSSTFDAGDGGKGGVGGNISITNNYGITTYGLAPPTSPSSANPIYSSFGILAQSIGGGAGAGGTNNNGVYGAGGSSKPGGMGGDVTVINNGNISTQYGYALVGISAGGYGGNGGDNSGFVASPNSVAGYGGNAGTVTITNNGTLQTNATSQHALIGISVGGGGGIGGSSVGFSSIGGSGGDGADGGTVSIFNGGTIQTLGTQSIGVAAISVGGGGGMGGLSSNAVIGGSGGSGAGGGDGGTVSVKNSGSICTGGGCATNTAYVPPSNTTDNGNAAAIAAISIGGGGGAGGYSKSVGFPFSVAVGGAGGAGGNGGSVWVSNNGILKTTEITSPGVFAASIGGGGGQGGGTFSIAADATMPTLSMSYGGSGGNGGDAGTVGINCGQANATSSSACSSGALSYSAPTANAVVTTYGSSSPAFQAQSVGGGGGTGGFAVGISASVLLSSSLSVGGSGGGGGNGGAVYASTGGVNTVTYGAQSSGVETQSIGGGGGHGGITFDPANYTAGAAAATVSGSISVGGSGGDGGKGGDVVAENLSGSITTYGKRADGIYAASIGGRGGRAGVSSEASAGVALQFSTSIGGAGGSGNIGGDVTVNNTGPTSKINVYGNDSHAIQAMSIGGGGGTGGLSAAGGAAFLASSSYAVGGTGGSGGDSGEVTVNNSGALGIYGLHGAGIFAASIGGGGGNGGSSTALSAAIDGGFSTSTGGQGTGGANSSNVTVNNDGFIVGGSQITPAIATQGILALSIGGGGGRGGLVVGASVTLFPLAGIAMSDVVGGGTGDGGKASTASVVNNGSIILYGDMSNGITAQSIGGRGGFGGIAVGGSATLDVPLAVVTGSEGGRGGRAGPATVTNKGLIETYGFRSTAITAQSIGGGGGIGGISMGGAVTGDLIASSTISIGGDGGYGGFGGSASIYNYAAVATVGEFSAGLLSQSIGGGGGIGGIGIGKSDTLVAPSQTLGGDGGGGSFAGHALISSSGSVVTYGNNSVGMLVQSIGGNGGVSGHTKAGISADRAGNASSGVLHLTSGDTGGSGANANIAEANITGPVTTYGALSTAIALESIGGGGGRAGSTLNDSVFNTLNTTSNGGLVNLGATGGAGGDGGVVNLTQSGKVTTYGPQSEGIYGGSIGGGGGSSGISYTTHAMGSKSFNLTIGGHSGSSGNGGDVTLNINSGKSVADSNYTIYSQGAASDAVFAQSIGGGGGAATGFHYTNFSEGSFASGNLLGSNGSSGGNGGAVNINTGGFIGAAGIGSNAILAQSIGAGGGKSISGLVAIQYSTEIMSSQIAQANTGDGSTPSSNVSAGNSNDGTYISINPISGSQAQTYGAMTLGAYSSLAGDGGAVTIVSNSENATYKPLSDGIKAQSIGGGGGYSSLVDQYSTTPFAAAAMFLGGNSSHGGDGGYVSVSQNYYTHTEGDGSTGVLAQSIGGGGGDARQISLSGIGLSSAFASQLGVKAQATGGRGGDVVITNPAYIWTAGAGSDGLVAQSIGGGGGFAGMYGSSIDSISFARDYTQTTSNARSGQNIPAAITTSSVSAAYAGISGESINAGTSVVALRGISMSSVLGASGGSGNDGGTASITSNASIITGSDPSKNSDGSFGIIAQSIGGGGGIAREHLQNFDQSQTSLALLLGTTHNASGDSASVFVSNNLAQYAQGFQINTAGRGSIGILAQSIGGGGGLGMLTEATSGAGGSAAIAMTLGSENSSHGVSSNATIQSGGIITTAGDQAEGIVAQSISNGGGLAKASTVSSTSGTHWSDAVGTVILNQDTSSGEIWNWVAGTSTGLAAAVQLGSNSSEGNNAHDVTVTSSSTITTYGARSTGIVAQSIGGGGGLIDITASGLNGGNLALLARLGGSAPSNTTDAIVSVTSSAHISTYGLLSDGILAQSIGGGGGSLGVITASPAAGSISRGEASSAITLGSSLNEGVNTHAGAVNVYVPSYSDINTHGFGSSAVTAQSIGNGGGLLAYWIGTGNPLAVSGYETLGSTAKIHGYGGDVSITFNPGASTYGIHAPLLIAQSIGGGGGRVVGNQQISTDTRLGANLSGGYSGSVSVVTEASLVTHGDYSPVLIAQSIGGGGGIIDHPVGGNLYFGGTGNNNSNDNASDGRPVNVSLNGQIITYGLGSPGVVAQSIGGGGGFASQATEIITFGSQSEYHGNGENVIVNSNAPITTSGNLSPGIVAASIGGGGGLAIFTGVSGLPVYANKGVGDSGDVTVNVQKNIQTTGISSHGVVAFSGAGGAGLTINQYNGLQARGGIGKGNAGNVAVNVYPGTSISATGAMSSAVWGVSLNGKNDPQVTIGEGASLTGGAGGSGIFLSGAINVVNNSGYIGTVDGVTGRAIVTDMGTATINNSGVTVGDITLRGSGNVINNLAAGRMYLTRHPDMGADGVLYNSGFLQFNPQGLSGLGALAHTGRLIQLDSGVLGIQYDHQAAATHQALVASSISAEVGSRLELGGSIQPVLLNPGLIAPGSAGPTSIISNNGGTLIHDQLGVVNTAIMTYGLVKDSSGVQLTSTANFAPAGLPTSSSQIGSAIGSYQTAGSNAFFQAATAQLVTVPTVGALDQAYNSLAGAAIQAMPQANYQAVVRAMGTVSDRMNSWRVGDSFIATTKNPRALMTGAASMNQPITPNAPQVANGTLPADGGQLPITSLEKTTDARTWITPFGGTSNSNNLADQIYGGSLGIEAQSDDRKFIGGAAMTISQSNYTYSSATTPATPGSATNYGAQFYFGARHESAYLSAIGYLGGSSGNFTRQLQTLGFNTTSGVNVHSNIMGARVEAGYNLLPNPQGKATLQVTPFVAIQPTQIRQNGANENFGSLGSGFYYGSNINTAVPVYLGAEISGDVAMGHNEVMKPFLRVSWAHDLMNNPMAMGAAYNSSTGPTLYANGTPSMGNMVILKGGAKYSWGTKVSAYATIDVEQGNAAYSYRGIGGSVGAIYSW